MLLKPVKTRAVTVLTVTIPLRSEEKNFEKKE
jgi:hypothetical protein